MHARDEYGLTLIELIVIIVIIGIVSGIVVASLGDSTTQAAKNSCIAQIEAVQNGINRYVRDGNGRANQFDSIETINTLLVPSYLATPVEQVEGFTIAVTDGEVTGTFGIDDTPCE